MSVNVCCDAVYNRLIHFLTEDFFFLHSHLGNHFYTKLLLSEDANDTSTRSAKHKADGVVACEEIENKFYFPQGILCLYTTIMKMSIFWLKA